MSGRQINETTKAIDTVRKGSTISQAARKHGIAVTTLRRALRRAGEPPRKPGRLPR